MDLSPLLEQLESVRRHVIGALEGLTTEQLRTPVPPTSWAPIAVPHHLALDVERWWFQGIVAGDRAAWAYFDADPGGAWSVPAELSPDDVIALYRRECAAADTILATLTPDARPAQWPEFLGREETVAGIVLHVIAETAMHAGHLDIVREAIDGSTWLVLD
jgi:hypothetical protein